MMHNGKIIAYEKARHVLNEWETGHMVAMNEDTVEYVQEIGGKFYVLSDRFGLIQFETKKDAITFIQGDHGATPIKFFE